MQVLKTWLTFVGVLALVVVSLAFAQARRTLAGREAEIERLKASRPPTAASIAIAPAPTTAGPAAAPPDDTELLAMTTDRDRYRDGLNRCVDEINRLAARDGERFELPPMPAAPARAPAAPAAALPPAAEPHITALYGEATVTPLGDEMLVTGRLFNTGTVSGTGTAVVTLLRDGRRANTGRIPVKVPAQGQASWSYKFPWHSQQGSWTATVSVEP